MPEERETILNSSIRGMKFMNGGKLKEWKLMRDEIRSKADDNLKFIEFLTISFYFLSHFPDQACRNNSSRGSLE